jgi:hypothetical protein
MFRFVQVYHGFFISQSKARIIVAVVKDIYGYLIISVAVVVADCILPQYALSHVPSCPSDTRCEFVLPRIQYGISID